MATPYLTLTAATHKPIEAGLADLDERETLALAQFLKRVGHAEYRACASSEEEAYSIGHAVAKLQRLLADAGISPR